MDNNQILRHWYACIYDDQEPDQGEAADIIKSAGNPPLDILEVACGSGRIAIPLALAGHNVTGFDIDEHMLSRIPHKAAHLKNLKYFKADALSDGWPCGFDVVVVSGNLLVNIVTLGDYAAAQELLIKKAAACVKPGGHLYLDFTCIVDWQDVAMGEERPIFEGTDDVGTYGKFIYISGQYNHSTRIDKSLRRYEIAPANGEAFTVTTESVKHFPTFGQVAAWLKKYGWCIEWHSPIENKTFHAKIWATIGLL